MTQALAESLAPPSASDTLSEKDFARLADIVGRYVGIRLPPTKRLMAEGRLRRRVRALGLGTIADYCRLLYCDTKIAEELVHLIDAVTTNKTDFFREPAHFDFLKQRGIASILAGRTSPAQQTLKIWSAASSNGAEAYSIAMMLAELSPQMGGFRYAVLGTDISTEILDQARRAIYPETMIAPIPRDMQRRYLMKARGATWRNEVRIVPEIRRHCRFARLNLMDRTFPFDRDIDVIFLRNVLIYFDKPTQHAVISRVTEHLRPGGYLLLGHSESMIGCDLPLRQVASATFERI